MGSADGVPVVTVSGDAADVFRQHFGVDSLAQARSLQGRADALFQAGGHPWADRGLREVDRDTFRWAADTVVARYENGTYQEPPPETRVVEQPAPRPPSGHIGNATQWEAVCIDPDYCVVGGSVVPFDTHAVIDSPASASTDVRAQGVSVYRVGDHHRGVQGDAGAGLVSGTSQGSGHVRFLTGHRSVRVNGLPVVTHESLCLVNCDAAGQGGAIGQLLTATDDALPAPVANAPADDAPSQALQALIDRANDDRSLWQRSGDFLSGAWDATRRVAGASVDSPGQTLIGVLKGLGNLPTDLWNLAVLGSKYSAGPMPPPALRAAMIERAALQAHLAGDAGLANELADRAAEMMSEGYADDLFELKNDAQLGGSILSMAVPVGAAVKGAGTAGRAGRAASAGDTAGDAARGTNAGGAAADASRAEGAGVHVSLKKPPPDGWATYRTHGIYDDPMASREGRRLVNEYREQGFNTKEANAKARELLESGSTLPQANPAAIGDRFYKLAPEGGSVGPNSAYWVTRSEVDSLRGLSRDQIASRLGLPLESQQALRFDVLEIRAQRPTRVYVSRIAPTSQNGWHQAGGGVQSLITDRSAFSAPVRTGEKFP